MSSPSSSSVVVVAAAPSGPPPPVVYAVKSRPVVVTPPPEILGATGPPGNGLAAVGVKESKEGVESGASTILSAALNGERRGPPQLHPANKTTTSLLANAVPGSRIPENGPDSQSEEWGALRKKRFSQARKSTSGLLVPSNNFLNDRVTAGKVSATGDGNSSVADVKRRNSVPVVARKSTETTGLAKKWKCPAVYLNCWANFVTERELDEHIAEYKNHGVCRYTCNACGREFAHPIALDIHFEEAHKGQKPNAHKCKFCPEGLGETIQVAAKNTGNPGPAGSSQIAGKPVVSQNKEVAAEEVEKGHSLPIKKRGHRQSRTSSAGGQSSELPDQLSQTGKNGYSGIVVSEEAEVKGHRDVHFESSPSSTSGTPPSSSGTRIQRKRNHPKWMDNMVMEFDLPQTVGASGKSGSAVSSPTAGPVANNRSITARKSTADVVVNEISKAGSTVQRGQRDRAKSANDTISGIDNKKSEPFVHGVIKDMAGKKRSTKSSPGKKKTSTPKRRSKGAASKISKNESGGAAGMADGKGRSRQSIDKMLEDFIAMEVDEPEPNAEIVSKALSNLNKAKTLREMPSSLKNDTSGMPINAKIKVTLKDIGDQMKESKTAGSSETVPPTLNAIDDAVRKESTLKQDKIPMPHLIPSDAEKDSKSTKAPELKRKQESLEAAKSVESVPVTESSAALTKNSASITEAAKTPQPTMKSSNQSEASTRGKPAPVALETPTITTRSTRNAKNQQIVPQDQKRKPIDVSIPSQPTSESEVALNGTGKEMKQQRISLRSSEKSKVLEKTVPIVSGKTEESQSLSSETHAAAPRVSTSAVKTAIEASATRKRKVEVVVNKADGESSSAIKHNQQAEAEELAAASTPKRLKGTRSSSVTLTQNATVCESQTSIGASPEAATTPDVSRKELQGASEVVLNNPSVFCAGTDIKTSEIEPISNQEIHFEGMPKLLVQEDVPPVHLVDGDEDADDSESDSDIEPDYKNLQLPSPPTRRQSTDPFIKDEAIQFLCKKVSNRSMLRIRNELMTLKKKGNYFKLTKTAPLAAGLIHDMFCHSFNLPEDDFQ